MISPIIAAQTATPVATVQQHTDSQSVLHTQTATQTVEKEVQQQRETVVHKEEAAYYEQSPDAKEEGRNKYQNLYSKKKKKANENESKDTQGVNRVNFDIKL